MWSTGNGNANHFSKNTLVIVNTLFQQHKTLRMNITRWSILKSDWLYSLQPKMETLCTVSENKTGSGLWLRSWLLIAKFRFKLKKMGETTRPFRYDLNQIPYDYIVEVTNRFKGLDLIEYLMNYGWKFMTLYSRQGSRPSPRKRNAKRLSEEALQIAVKRREPKSKEERKDIPIWMQSSK